jgi:hypothetical protein
MSDQLHALVHSLEKSERRFLRLYAEMGAGPAHGNYLVLLDALLALPAWDEAHLLDRLRAGALRDNLSSNKTRLLDLVLKSQRLLHAGKDVHTELRNHLTDIELLMAKSLFPAAHKRLRKAKVLARHYEEEAVLLQLLHLELQLAQHPPFKPTEDILGQELPDCLVRLQEAQGHHLLYERLRLHVRLHGRTRTPEAEDALAALRADAMLSSVPAPLRSQHAHMLRQQVLGTYHLLRGEFDMAVEALGPLLALWAGAPDLIAHRTGLYLSCLNNYLSTCLSVQALHPRFLAAVEATRQLQGLPSDTRLLTDQVAYVQELNYRFNFSTLLESNPFILEISAWIDTHAKRLKPAYALNLYHNLALFHFIYGAHKPANAWLQYILNFPDTATRADIHDFAPIFQLVLQYELQNFDLTDYLLRNASRRIQREGRLLELEKAVLDWFKRLQKVSLQSTAAQRQSLQQLLDQLRALAGQPGRPPLGLNELILWAESHLEGVSLAQHVQRRMFG